MTLLEGIDLAGLLLALILPWIAGTALVAALLPRERPSLLVGHGYLVGQLLVILLLLVWGASGLTWDFAVLAGVITLVALPAVFLWWRQAEMLAPSFRFRWRQLLHLAWALPLAFFAIERGGALLHELALRPLYPWDAWMNWVPRAIVWFEHGGLTPFVTPDRWLEAPPGSDVRTLGNWRAAEYPRGVPLILLWVMLGAGTADHTLIYIPWLLLPASVAFAIWGHLRNHDLVPWAAALAVYAFLSQPLFNTQSVLAGYADTWLAAAFGLGGMALAEWHRSADPRHALIAVAMALCCALFKTPGLIFGLILLFVLTMMWWRPNRRLAWWTALAAGGLIAIGLILATWPGLPYLVDSRLELPDPFPFVMLVPLPLLPHLWDTMFVMANWHLMWPLLFFALGAGLLHRGRRALENPAFIVLAIGLCFLLVVFGFTQYSIHVERGTTFHRTLLYMVPLGIVVAFQQLAPLLRRNRAKPDAAEP